ncbi:MAG: ATP-binding protein [Psychroflexus halocasei]
MRYLNKIVFINSATVKYAEIELDGNVHLIGTQGVGKSTLLRAILFFYNANKSKLGIPREKKGFDDYYFQYQNSYIIYEIIKDGIPFCVLAYKVNGKVAFRFFNSGYKRELFIDQNNRAFESWDKIRNAFGKEIHYSNIVASYTDFRKIIYGDNKGLKPDFRKYALIESKQYQNIPLTIQNVLLNSNLEAKFIKDTIINSLSEEEFSIDLENYAKGHLQGFESQINDIQIWFKKNRKGEVTVRKQADKVIDQYRIFNHLQREKSELANDLSLRMQFIDREKPLFLSELTKEKNALAEWFKKQENLKKTQQNREQRIVSEITYLKKELEKAAEKETDYQRQNITKIIQRVANKTTLEKELKALEEERNLLKSAFGEINQKYEALITQAENQHEKFVNSQQSEINTLKANFAERKSEVFETYQKLIDQVKEDHQLEKDKAENEITALIDKEHGLKNKKSELKHQTFFKEEIEASKIERLAIEEKLSTAKSKIQNAKNETATIRKEWELEEKEIERSTEIKISKTDKNIQKVVEEIESIERKINQSKASFYGWLNENIPNWAASIGKVIDEENVLFNTELHPKLVNDNSTSFFGVELNLNTLENRVKTVSEYKEEIKSLTIQAEDLRKALHQINKGKEDDLRKLKIKFRKKLNQQKEIVSDNDYQINQAEQQLKKNDVEREEWTEKSKSEKKRNLEKIENDLNAVADQKQKANTQLANIKQNIKRKITLKENERNAEISTLEENTTTKIESIKSVISSNEKEIKQRIYDLKKDQNHELADKGADTKRIAVIENKTDSIEEKLAYIKQHEALVIEYNKEKREVFDKVPEWKTKRLSLEKQKDAIVQEHQVELGKLVEKLNTQEAFVAQVQSKVNELDSDEKAFEEFKKSEAFMQLEFAIDEVKQREKDTKTGNAIIAEIKDNYYKGIDVFKSLQQATNAFNGNFALKNTFSFDVQLNTDDDFLKFAEELKEFIEEDKIQEYEKRVNERFAQIIHLIGRETTELNSKKGAIEKVIKKINDDFTQKNFVEAIKEMEIRTLESSNPVVKWLIRIQEFNDENNLLLGETSLFTSVDSHSKNHKAVDLLKELVKAIERYKSKTLTLSESFDLQFRIVENDNDSGWVEKLSNVGSEGTDVLVKAMINILLLNVFKDSASKKFKDFKLHCMMDEIGRLHPNNVKGILRFANERNILLINGSPTSQNATDYKYTYKLAKEQSKSDAKKYFTRINRLVKMHAKVKK